MALLRFPDGRTKEVDDGTQLTKPCISMGIPIMNGCLRGICGGCRSRIVKGYENIEKVSDAGERYLEEDEVLLCQTRILRGEITIEW